MDSVTTLPAGQPASVTNTGTSSAAKFAFGIPQGAAGNAATLSLGTVTTLAAGASATVTMGGTAQERTISFGLPQGAAGQAATIALGTVSTLAAGSAASVTMGGTAQARTLNFAIPQGADGSTPTLTIGTVNTLNAGEAATATIGGTALARTLNLGLPRGADAEMPRRAILTYAGADLTWTYPTAFPAGVVPIIEALAAPAATSTALFNVQLVGDPTNTSCKLRINTIPAASVSLLGLVNLNLFQQAPSGVKVHLTARAP